MHDLEQLTQELINKVPMQYRDITLKCIDWGQRNYTGNNRLSGENTIFHALRVANTASDLHLDTNSILVCILHCALNNEYLHKREKLLKEIEEIFGTEVINILDTLDKINQGTDSIETDRKIITRYVLRNSEDIRAILIKIFDVLDDVRTIEYLPQEGIKEKAKKVFDIYGPLCSYLNLEPLKKEMEEIVFKHTKPEEYLVIEEKIAKEGINDALLDKYIEEIEKIAEVLGYKPKIFGRIKSKFSIYNKLKKLENEGKSTALKRIKDLVAVSIITKSKDDCFLLKMAFEENSLIDEERTDDYITNPKPNGFQALQINTSYPEIRDASIEIQILTYKMYYINTYGPASHIAYKASKNRFAKPTDSFDWLEKLHKQIINCQSLSKQARSVPIKADIFENYIYTFTPKGRIIELNKDATALDFAYRVHTRVGHNATFAQINGETKDLSTMLNTGDVVNIVNSHQDKYPNRNWMDFAICDSTKEKIRKALKMKAIQKK